MACLLGTFLELASCARLDVSSGLHKVGEEVVRSQQLQKGKTIISSTVKLKTLDWKQSAVLVTP